MSDDKYFSSVNKNAMIPKAENDIACIYEHDSALEWH